MTVEGELDDISGVGQTRAALDMCSSVPEAQKRHLEAEGAGHYGIFSGRRWRDVVYPAVKNFILENNQATQPALQSVQQPAIAAVPAVAMPVAISSAPVAAEKQLKEVKTTPADVMASKQPHKLAPTTEKPVAKPILVAGSDTAAQQGVTTLPAPGKTSEQSLSVQKSAA